MIDNAAAKQAATYSCDPPCENPPWYRVNTNVLIKTAIELNYAHNNIAQPPVYEGICIIQWWLDIKCSKRSEAPKPKEYHLVVEFPESETVASPATLSQMYLTDEEFVELNREHRATTKYCSGVVASAMGMDCDYQECQAFVGKKLWYQCEDGKCPIMPGVWYSIPSDCGAGGVKWLSGCIVQFGNVGGCE